MILSIFDDINIIDEFNNLLKYEAIIKYKKKHKINLTNQEYFFDKYLISPSVILQFAKVIK